MEMTGLQIFKYMPAAKKTEKSNCRECGCATCMMFSLKLAKQQIELNKCPYLDDELKEKYLQGVKHPQNIINIGSLKIGGENVLYRHEKTFINPVVLSVLIDCSEDDYLQKITEISNFKFIHAGENFGVDLIILKNFKSRDNFSLDKNNIQIITYEEFINTGINLIKEENFEETKLKLVNIRTQAILKKDESYCDPVCVLMNKDDIYSQCFRAGYYICKYANMLLFENFDKEMFSTLIMLRYSIFTDPQKTLQVEPGLYEFNNPDKNSIIFLTTNFALTYFAVANELENLEVPSYLIVVPAQGMSVLTAWSAQTFTQEIVKKALKDFDIKNRISTRKIIISGFMSELIEELNQECEEFEFVEGTKDASDIANYVKSNLHNLTQN